MVWFQHQRCLHFSMNRVLLLTAILLLPMLSSCRLLAVAFKAGVWVGVLIVVVLAALLSFLLAKVTGKE